MTPGQLTAFRRAVALTRSATTGDQDVAAVIATQVNSGIDVAELIAALAALPARFAAGHHDALVDWLDRTSDWLLLLDPLD